MTNFAYELNKKSGSFVSDADLSSYQYYAVKMNTTEEIVLASDANDRMLGVLQDAPAAAGRTCEVALEGISKAVGGAAIDAGAAVEVGTGGKFVTLTTGPIAGIAVTACGADGEQFSLDIIIGE
jgi:hypothetical protein